MRQSPLLSLTVGAALGMAIGACSGDSRLEPISKRSERASAEAGGEENQGGLGSAGVAGLDAESNGGSAGVAGASGYGGAGSHTGGTGPSTGGSQGSGGVRPVDGCTVLPDPNGWVAAALNDCGIQGAWYSYSDCDTSPADCTTDLLPEVGSQFTNTNGKMCTSGATASINDSTEVDAKWGAGIGLSLNEQADQSKETIAQLPHELIAFRFTVSGTAIPEELRVNFPTPTTASIEHFVTITGSGEHTVDFLGVSQGDWVDPQTPLDPADVIAIQFQVPARFNEQVAFDYCIENFQALY